MESTMQKAVAYLRVSTDRQAAEGVSLDAQREKISAWCTLHDCELEAVYVDEGLSGKRADNRPQLQAALDHVCKAGGVLVVYSLSRLARSTRDTIAISDRLQKSGADLASLSERIDTTSAVGRMVFRLLAVLAEFERDVISERTSMAADYKRGQGKRIFGRIPYGFHLAEDGESLVADPVEQAGLQTMRDMRSGGAPLREIVDHLNRERVPTKGGKPWTISTVHALLSPPKASKNNSGKRSKQAA
jgi:DNA invertase Pin-like site-specific DNA recombinase